MNDEEAPERIWAWESLDENKKRMGIGEWYTEEVGLDGDEVEYIRADLAPKLPDPPSPPRKQ